MSSSHEVTEIQLQQTTTGASSWLCAEAECEKVVEQVPFGTLRWIHVGDTAWIPEGVQHVYNVPQG